MSIRAPCKGESYENSVDDELKDVIMRAQPSGRVRQSILNILHDAHISEFRTDGVFDLFPNVLRHAHGGPRAEETHMPISH